MSDFFSLLSPERRLVQCGSLHSGCPKRGEINFTSFNRWAFCRLLPGGWESSSLAGCKLSALGNFSIVIDTRYCFLLHCSMINAYLQQIWDLMEQNDVILQRKKDFVIWVSASSIKNFELLFPLFYTSEICEILCILLQTKMPIQFLWAVISNQNSLICACIGDHMFLKKKNAFRKPYQCNRQRNQLHQFHYFVLRYLATVLPYIVFFLCLT